MTVTVTLLWPRFGDGHFVGEKAQRNRSVARRKKEKKTLSGHDTVSLTSATVSFHDGFGRLSFDDVVLSNDKQSRSEGMSRKKMLDVSTFVAILNVTDRIRRNSLASLTRNTVLRLYTLEIHQYTDYCELLLFFFSIESDASTIIVNY